MRRGRIFKRCSQCSREFSGKRCTKPRRLPDGSEQECGSERFTWAYQVDVAPVGGVRDRRSGAGFSFRAGATAMVASLQQQVADHTFVEPSRLTVAGYLRQWWEAGRWSGNAKRDYRVAIERHISPRLSDVPLQALTSVQIRGL